MSSRAERCHILNGQALLVTRPFWVYAIDFNGLDEPIVHRFNVLDGLDLLGFEYTNPDHDAF